jgi:hypothetical protein
VPEDGLVVLPEQAPLTVLRSLAKQTLVEDALAGRRSLREVAGLFAALNELPPHFTPRAEPADATLSEAERLGVQVVRFAHVAIDLDRTPSSEARAALARLEADLTGMAAERLPIADARAVNAILALAARRLAEERVTGRAAS